MGEQCSRFLLSQRKIIFLLTALKQPLSLAHTKKEKNVFPSRTKKTLTFLLSDHKEKKRSSPPRSPHKKKTLQLSLLSCQKQRKKKRLFRFNQRKKKKKRKYLPPLPTKTNKTLPCHTKERKTLSPLTRTTPPTSNPLPHPPPLLSRLNSREGNHARNHQPRDGVQHWRAAHGTDDGKQRHHGRHGIRSVMPRVRDKNLRVLTLAHRSGRL